MLAQALKREPEGPVVVDASGLQQFDTSVIAVLLECQRLSQAWGKGFSVKNAPAKLASLAKLYGVDPLLKLEAACTPSPTTSPASATP